MATFEIWYNEVETFKAYFEAETEEEARELMDDLRNGRTDWGDIEGWDSRGKDYHLEIDLDNLKSID